MTPRVRTLFLWTTAGVFLLAAPLLVLYVSGFRFKLSERRVYAVGVLSVTSQPGRARILLDGKDTGALTPARVALLPGDHTVTIEKDGYLPWTKRIAIFSRGSTFLRNVPLLKDQKPVALTRAAPILAAALAPSARTFAYAVSTTAGSDLFVGSATAGEPTPVATVLGSVSGIAWSATERSLLVEGETNGQRFWQIVSLTAGKAQPVPLLDPERDRQLTWSPLAGNVLYLRRDGALLALQLDTEVLEPVGSFAGVTVRDFTVFGDQLIALGGPPEAQELSQLSLSTGERTLLAALPEGDYRLLPSSGRTAVVNLRRGETALYERRGGTTLVTAVPLAARTVSAVSGQKGALLTTETDVWFFGEDGTQELISRYAQGLATALLFRTGMVVMARGNQLLTVDISQGTPEAPFVLDAGDPESRVALLGPDGGRTAIFYTIPTGTGAGIYRRLLR